MGVATTSGLLRRPYSIMRNTINTSTIHASVQQADRKMTTPARLYRRVVRVLPCYEKPEMGARHHESKLQVEGFRLVVAEKGMRTNVKNAHGLLRGFVPSHLEAVDEFVRSYASRVKKRPTTNARPLGNDLAAQDFKQQASAPRNCESPLEKAETNVVEARSNGPRQYRCRDLLMDADMLTRIVEENLKRKKLSW